MNNSFLHVNDLTKNEFEQIMNSSKIIKNKFKNDEKFHPLFNKTMAMIFAKPSARTRVSFETGFYKLGGHALYLGPNDIGIGKRESVSDIAKVLSRYNDYIMARLFDHKHIIELAENATVPVINGLTDYNHPCQIICDILTIWEHKGSLDNLKICYMGDGNNIVHSWLQLASRLPMDFVCCGPEGFEPDIDTVKMVEDSASSSFQLSHDPISAVRDADVIYTDVWASMGQKEEATEREKVFAPYQVNKDLINNTGKDTLFMHCLPAERGREVTDEVMESKNSIVFDQAENRMHAQNAIMAYLTNNYS